MAISHTWYKRFSDIEMAKTTALKSYSATTDSEISDATRRLLFRKVGGALEGIPGAGTSAAKHRERHTRLKITINLDGDLVDYFKAQGEEEGVGYQFLINQALREHVDGSRPERLAREIGELLISDSSFLEALSKKLPRI